MTTNMNSGIPTLFVDGDGGEPKFCNGYSQHDGRQERDGDSPYTPPSTITTTLEEDRSGKNLLW